MSGFIDTVNGHINLDQVREVRTLSRRKIGPGGKEFKEWFSVAITTDDERHQLLTKWQEVVEAVIPATLPMVLIEIWEQDEGEEPLVNEYPIVGWKITGNGAYPEPIAPGCDPDCHHRQFIKLPDGKYQQCGYQADLFNTLDGCKAAIERSCKRFQKASASL